MFHDETTEDDHDSAAMEIFIFRIESSHNAKKCWPKNLAQKKFPPKKIQFSHSLKLIYKISYYVQEIFRKLPERAYLTHQNEN